jgi:hypothetical protein
MKRILSTLIPLLTGIGLARSLPLVSATPRLDD